LGISVGGKFTGYLLGQALNFLVIILVGFPTIIGQIPHAFSYLAVSVS